MYNLNSLVISKLCSKLFVTMFHIVVTTDVIINYFHFGNPVVYCCPYLYIHIYNLLAHGVIAIFFQTITVHKCASSPYRYPY